MNNLSYKCPTCGAIRTLTKANATVLPFIMCKECETILTSSHRIVKKKGISDQQKRSRDQEKRSAKRDGGRVQPASGALPGAKGDVRKEGVFLKECKETVAKSFSVKRTILEKIEREAVGEETPVLEIELQQHPYKRVYVIPEWCWQEYMELKSEHQKHR